MTLIYFTFKQDFSLDVLQSNNETSENKWLETQERGDKVVSADETGQVGPRASCRCQVMRVGIPNSSWYYFSDIRCLSPHSTNLCMCCTAINNLTHILYTLILSL